ncbi:MAG: hypothetical protein ACLUAB_10715 [Ruminococcus sp.]
MAKDGTRRGGADEFVQAISRKALSDKIAEGKDRQILWSFMPADIGSS